MQKVLRLVLVLSLPLFLTSFHIPEKEKLKWLSLTELQSAFAKQPRPIIIDVYTDWCGWCKVMDRETYSNEKVIGYLNKKFYAVKFNAESKAEVVFANKKYAYNPAYNANELAVYLLGGRMGYPTTVFLSALDAQPAPLSGYLKPTELEPPVKYFGDGAYKKQDYPTFMKGFAGTW